MYMQHLLLVFFYLHGYSCLCRTILLCIQNLHIIKVTDRPDIRHLRSLPYFLSHSILAHLFTGILDKLCGSYNHRRLLFLSRRLS